MSFGEGDYSSVFGDTTENQVGWYEPYYPTIEQAGWLGYLEDVLLGVFTPTPEVAEPVVIVEPVESSGDPGPVALPVLGEVDSPSIDLPAVVLPVLAGGTAGATGEDATDWVVEEDIEFEGEIPEEYIGEGPTGNIDPYEVPEIIPEDFGVAHDDTGDADVAIDFGDIFGAALGEAAQQLVGPAVMPGVTPTAPPAKVTVDTRTGKVTACRRRRRRRLLTPTDLADLASLASLVGKQSDAMKFAVTKAVRR